ncbi:MAG TPA: nickel-dependent lactate racemase [Vicinamibacteria bacterium]|nr:nickel-dependent lactate racemase [Vicinamibacteria bacterium]
MKFHLQYGRDGLAVDIPGEDVTVIEPRFLPGLPDEKATFIEAVRKPIGSRPLREIVGAADRLAVVIADLTRPLPSDRLLPWLFEELAHVSAERITIVNGTGSHRTNTTGELASMVGAEVLRRYRVVNHTAHDLATLRTVGRSADGETVYLDRAYVEADRRIVLGFIEPHFMAGFSGGYKGIFPALADIASIMRYHDARTIGDPRSTWGRLEGNPTQAIVRHNGSLLPLDFCINLTLNRRREITRFFCGDPIAAHEEGCRFSRQTAMVACQRAFPVVVTTNSGYPLDQNLYQTVKGLSAAAQIVEGGGYIAAASRCNDGFPEHGNFRKLLFEHGSPRALLDAIEAPGFSLYDQWEAQLLALVRLKARVGLLSELPPEDVRRAHLEPIPDLAAAVARELREKGADAPVAVLPEGPQTIPYLAGD